MILGERFGSPGMIRIFPHLNEELTVQNPRILKITMGSYGLCHGDDLDVSENRGVPPNHPFVHRVFHYFHHSFWGVFPLFLVKHPFGRLLRGSFFPSASNGRKNPKNRVAVARLRNCNSRNELKWIRMDGNKFNLGGARWAPY